MAYTVGDNAILEMTIRGEQFGETTLSILHYRLDTTLGPQPGVTLIDEIDADVTGPNGLLERYASCCSDAFFIRQMVYQWVWPQRYARRTLIPSISTGTQADAMLPSNTAVAITKRTDIAGRTGIGTLHMPGIAQSNVDGNRIVQAGIIPYEALSNALTAPINLGLNRDMTPVIYRRTAPAASPVVTSCEPIAEVRTMRRRGVRLGI